MFDLAEVPQAVRTYLNTKVGVKILSITPTGAAINPNETFTFRVEVKNADALHKGVALNNVKYRVAVANSAVAKIQVPAAGTSTSLTFPFPPLAPGTFVEGFIYNPASAGFDLPVGDTDNLQITGKAGVAIGGGATAINARILADVDFNLLFPKGEDSTPANEPLTVVG